MHVLNLAKSIFQYPMIRSLKILISSIVLLCSFSIANADPVKPAYYRYYDSKGVVTISRNVSQAHIRHGYEVLDRNMYLIKKVPAYNVDQDVKQESNRAAQYQKRQRDQQIIRSYRNVTYATQKKNETLNIIQKQINEQYLRMKRIQSDRASFLTQKADLIFNKKPIPIQLQKNLENNEANMKHVRENIQKLKAQLAQQEQFFDDIINRLQMLE